MFYDKLHFQCAGCGVIFNKEPADLKCNLCGYKIAVVFDGIEPENDLELPELDEEEDYDETRDRDI